jgi:hypothetical protein
VELYRVQSRAVQPRLLRSLCAALALALLAALLVYAWRGTYSRYLTDDYCSAARLHNTGFAAAMKWHWTEWTGRYSYYALKAIPESIGPATAPVMPALLIALFCASAVWAMRRVTHDFALLCGLAIVFASIDATPDILSPFGPFLWETGAMTYMLPLILYALWLGIFFVPRSLGVRCALSAALMLIAGGLSETSLAAQLGLTVGILFLAIVRRMPEATRVAAAGLLATLASAVIASSAPGNVKRMAGLNPRPLLDAIADAFHLGFFYIGSNAFVDGASFIVLIACGLLLARTRSRAELATILLLALAACGAFIASILPSTWMLSGSPPPRALHVSTFFFALMIFALAVAWGVVMPRFARIAGPVLLVVSIAIAALSVSRVTWTMDDGRRFAQEADRIDRIMRANAGKDLSLHAPYGLAERMVFRNTDEWVNRCLCEYYGVRTLQVTR